MHFGYVIEQRSLGLYEETEEHRVASLFGKPSELAGVVPKGQLREVFDDLLPSAPQIDRSKP